MPRGSGSGKPSQPRVGNRAPPRPWAEHGRRRSPGCPLPQRGGAQPVCLGCARQRGEVEHTRIGGRCGAGWGGRFAPFADPTEPNGRRPVNVRGRPDCGQAVALVVGRARDGTRGVVCGVWSGGTRAAHRSAVHGGACLSGPLRLGRFSAGHSLPLWLHGRLFAEWVAPTRVAASTWLPADTIVQA